jgi:hypothetical protein
MTRKGVVSMVGVVAIVAVVVLHGAASAHGKGGHQGGGDGNLWLLARAAGLSRSQIATAFKNDSNLKTDRSNLRIAREALTTCLVSGSSCPSQISAYASAHQTLAQERMTVWGTPLPRRSQCKAGGDGFQPAEATASAAKADRPAGVRLDWERQQPDAGSQHCDVR